MKKLTKIVKQEVKSLNPVSVGPTDLLPPELMQQLEDKMPQWLKEYVADGSAVLRWNWEFFIILEQILRDKFDFKDEDMITIEKTLKEIFPRIEKFKAKTPRLITKQDFAPGLKMISINRKLFLDQQEWDRLEAKKPKLLKK